MGVGVSGVSGPRKELAKKRSGLVHRQNLVVNSWDQLRGFRPVSLLCL